MVVQDKETLKQELMKNIVLPKPFRLKTSRETDLVITLDQAQRKKGFMTNLKQEFTGYIYLDEENKRVYYHERLDETGFGFNRVGSRVGRVQWNFGSSRTVKFGGFNNESGLEIGTVRGILDELLFSYGWDLVLVYSKVQASYGREKAAASMEKFFAALPKMLFIGVLGYVANIILFGSQIKDFADIAELIVAIFAVWFVVDLKSIFFGKGQKKSS